MILFRVLAFCSFSTEAYSSTSRCFSRQDWKKFGVPKSRQKTTPNQTFALYLWTATAPHKQLQQPGKLGDVSDGPSGAPKSSRMQPETTHELFSGTQEVATPQHEQLPNRKNTSFHVLEAINSAMAKSPMKKQLSPKVCYSQRGCFIYYSWSVRTRNTRGRKNYVTVRACIYAIGPKKGQKG